MLAAFVLRMPQKLRDYFFLPRVQIFHQERMKFIATKQTGLSKL